MPVHVDVSLVRVVGVTSGLGLVVRNFFCAVAEDSSLGDSTSTQKSSSFKLDELARYSVIVWLAASTYLVIGRLSAAAKDSTALAFDCIDQLYPVESIEAPPLL